MKAIWTLLFALIIGFPLTKAIGQEVKNENGRFYITYSLSDSEETLRLIKELKTGEEILPGDYNIKAQLSFKSDNKNVILESINFEPFKDNSALYEPPQQGWTSLNNTYFWKPEGKENVLTIPLFPKPINKNTSITAFDELHLDYNDLISKNPSLLSLKMIVSGRKLGKNKATVIIDGKQLLALKSINLDSAPWKKKGLSYLTKRKFGIQHDSSWNFIRKNKSYFYQNRFHLDLKPVETIDIQFKTDTSLEKINSLSCNLRIGFESLIIPSKILECSKFPKKIFKSNGNVVLRIWVGDLLHSKFIKNETAFLEEIIFMIPQKQLNNIQEQPVTAIQFRSLFQPKIPNNNRIKKDSEDLDIKDQVFHFQTPIITLSSKRKRLIFPLKKLTDQIGKSGIIKNIALSIQPEHLDSSAEFLLRHLRLVNYRSKERPAILNVGKNLSFRWGGPFFDQDENDEKIEWIKVRKFFSFKGPNIKKRSKLTTYLKDNLDGSEVKFTSDPIDFGGIQIHAQNGLHDWQADKNGLRLEGKGNWVEIDWPIKTKFDKNTWFFMDFGEGKENILDLKIKPFAESRELPSFSALPNKPEKIQGNFEEIKRLIIKISFLSSPFNFQLKEVGVFQPLLLNPSQILDSPTLIEKERLLFPKNVRTIPQEKVTIFKGHLSALLWPKKEGTQNTLSWTTEVNKKVGQLQGLKVIYKIPPTMHINNLCWLQLTLVSTNHEINRSICSENSTNQIIFPMENLFHGVQFQDDEILKNISWKILVKNKDNLKTQPQPFDVGVSLIGYDIRTLRSELLSHPFMEWNGTALFPASLDEVSREDIFLHNFLTNLGTVSIKRESEAIPFFNLLDHPYFQIEFIKLKKEEPISADDWVSLTKKAPEEVTTPEASQDTYFPKLLFLSLLAGGFWWAWRQKARFSSLKWWVELSPELAQKQIRVWLSIAAGHYLLGLIFSLIKWRTGADIFLSLAGLAIFLAYRSHIWKIRPDLESRHPELADKVYRGAGTHYIAGFLLTLVMAAIFLVVRLEFLAEQIAVVGYYMLVVGVILEFKAFRKENHEQKGEDESINTEKEATQA